MRGNITARITALWVVLFVAGLLSFALLASRTIVANTQETLDGALETQGSSATSAFDESGTFANDEPLPEIGGFAIAVFKGPLLRQIIGQRPTATALRQAASLPVGATATLDTRPVYRVNIQSANVRGYRVAAFGWESPVTSEDARLRRVFVMTGIPLLFFAALVGWLLARQSLAPIGRLSATAAQVARTKQFSTRFAVTSDDELGRLGVTFNDMLERLQETFERERALIGDVSHELRQPLSAVVAEAESPQEDRGASLERIARRAHEMNRILDDLLLFARADAGVLASGTSEVGDVLAEACSEIKRQFPAIGLRLDIESNSATIGLPQTLAVRLFANVVRNAAQAASKNVVVAATREGAALCVTVDDDGKGIRPEQRELLFRRFQRGNEARYSGSGLGLPIAAAIVQAAGGTIEAHDAPAGGARFTIRLSVRG